MEGSLLVGTGLLRRATAPRSKVLSWQVVTGCEP